MKTVVGLYDRREDARKAIQALVDAGFPRDKISIATKAEEGEVGEMRRAGGAKREVTRTREAGSEAGEGAAVGGTVGAVLGGIGGLLLGLGTLAIPGLGLIAAAGPLGGLLAGALAGGVTGGIVGALVGLGIPEEEAEVYAEGVRRGGTLVTMQAEDNRVNEAQRIMERYDPVNVEERAARWREQGWEGYEGYREEAEPVARGDVGRERGPFVAGREGLRAKGTEARRDIERGREGLMAEGEEMRHDIEGDIERGRRQVMAEGEEMRHEAEYEQPSLRAGERDIERDIVEEDVRIGKREVSKGGMRIRSYVTSEPVEEDVTLRREEIEVERRDMDRELEAGEFDFEEGEEVIELQETDEEVVVEKRPRVVGQVHVTKDVDTETRTVSETARRRDVEVEPIEGQQVTAQRSQFTGDEEVIDGTFIEFEPEFRKHYETRLVDTGRDFSYYRPAYMYGCRLAQWDKSAEHDWNRLEPEARRHWAEVNPDETWMEVRDAVHESYNRCRPSAA